MSVSEEILIAEIQKHNVLYDRSHPYYKKNHVREAAWEDISTCLMYDVDKCKKRWRTLRDAFIKSRRQKQLGAESGKKGKNWHLHDQMKFLIPFTELHGMIRDYEPMRNAKDSDDAEDDNDQDEEEDPLQVAASPPSPLSTSSIRSNSEEQTPSLELSVTSKRMADTSTTQPRKRQKASPANDNSCCMRHRNMLIVPNNDPDVLFMLSQVESLKKLSPRRNRYAKIKIQQLLYDLEFNGEHFSEVQPKKEFESCLDDDPTNSFL